MMNYELNFAKIYISCTKSKSLFISSSIFVMKPTAHN